MWLRRPIKTALNRFGYDIVRRRRAATIPSRPPNPPTKSDDAFRLQNFESLVTAYELCLNERYDKDLITANVMRSRLLARLLGTPPAEAYFIIEALALTESLPGDVCEFGVAQGETSALIANELVGSGKHLHLFDSFEGLPKPTSKDQLKDDIFSLGMIEAYAGQMVSPVDMVLGRLQAISFPASQYTIHKGFIEDVLPLSPELPVQVSCAYVDLDWYEPIKTALNFLNNITPPGAIIIVDDYDFFSTGAKAAVDEFLAEKNSPALVYELIVPDTRLGHFRILIKCTNGAPSPSRLWLKNKDV